MSHEFHMDFVVRWFLTLNMHRFLHLFDKSGPRSALHWSIEMDECDLEHSRYLDLFNFAQPVMVQRGMEEGQKRKKNKRTKKTQEKQEYDETQQTGKDNGKHTDLNAAWQF